MHAHSHSGDRQSHANPVNHSQRAMPLLVEAQQESHYAPPELIAKCRHRLDAIRLCVQLSGKSNEAICERMGIDKGHWTRIMQGRAWFPDPKSIELMDFCGNYAPLQYEAWATGHELKNAAQAKIERLERELAEARRAA